jgi:DNA-binding response OmpR family regulator
VAKILIVDGDPDVVQAGRIILEREGHEVLTAAHLENGLGLIEESMPDLVFLDCLIGGPGSCVGAAHAIRDRGFTQPILVLSVVDRAVELLAYSEGEMVSVGQVDAKPMDPDALSKSVELLLHGGDEASCFWPRT